MRTSTIHHRTVVALACLLSLAAPVSAVQIELDYSLDTEGFFDDPARRDVMELAADQVVRFIDALDAIQPSGGDTWDIALAPIGGPNPVLVEGPAIAANTIRIWAGSRNLTGIALAEAALGVPILGVGASPSFSDAVNYRGVAGAQTSPPTDFGPFGGTVVFDSGPGVTWHVGAGGDVVPANEFDLLTVAMHELFHTLGFGPAGSFGAWLVGGEFTGPEAVAASSPNNPDLDVPDGAHWWNQTLSNVNGVTQPALLNPVLEPGIRWLPTELDRAALRDMGWTEAVPGDVNLDGVFDFADVVQINTKAAFVAGEGFGWSAGDVNGDLSFDFDDVILINQAGAFSGGPSLSVAPSTVVPEPSSLVFLGAMSVFALLRRAGGNSRRQFCVGG